MTFQLITQLTTTRDRVRASAIDLVNGFLYVGEDFYSPGRITKIRLSNFTEAAYLTPTGTYIQSMSIDVSGGFLYYGCYLNTIGKIRLSNFTNVSTLTGKNNYIQCSVIDASGGFVYFGQSGGNIQKIQLSSFTSVGNLATGAGQLSGASIDKANDFMYFCDTSTSGKIVKVRISTFSVVQTINAGYRLSGSVIDVVNGFLYVYGSDMSPTGKVSQIRLSDFTLVQTTPNIGNGLLSGIIDITNQFAYFGGSNYVTGAPVYEINLRTFSLVRSINTNRVYPYGSLYTGQIDTVNNFIYFCHYFENTISKLGIDQPPPAAPNIVATAITPSKTLCTEPCDLTVDITWNNNGTASGTFTPTMIVNGVSTALGPETLGIGSSITKTFSITGLLEGVYNICSNPNTLPCATLTVSSMYEVGILTLPSGDNGNLYISIDPVNGFIYGGCGGSGRIVKIDALTFSEVGSISSASSFKNSSAIDLSNGYFYTGSNESPPKISKVWLPSFTEVATLSMGEGFIAASIVVDPSGFLYAGIMMSSGPDKIKKVRLSDFTIVNTLTLNTGEKITSASVIDITNKFAYFCITSNPGSVVKIDLTSFTRVGKLTFNSGEGNPVSAIIDTDKGFTYFGTDDSNGKVIKVNLSTFTKNSSITFIGDEGGAYSAVIDTIDNIAYFICKNRASTNYGNYCVKVNLNTFSRSYSIPLSTTGYPPSNAVLYPKGQNIFQATGGRAATWQGQIDKIFDSKITQQCSPIWVCEQPLNCYESDGCNRRINSFCCPCSSILLTTDKTTDIIGGIIRLTTSIQPIGQPFTATFKLNDTPLSSCIVSTIDGTCYIDWNTTGLLPGNYNITAEVTDQCSTLSPTTITLVPHCYSISLNISRPSEHVGETIKLIAMIQPVYQSLPVVFKVNNDPFPIGCATSDIDGTCSIDWDTTGVSPGNYDVTAEVTGQCTTIISVFIAAPKVFLSTVLSWPKFKGDSANTGRSPFKIPIRTLYPYWILKIGTYAFRSDPIIDSNGTIYIGSNDGKLYAINPYGTIKWTFQTNGSMTNAALIDDNGTIYVGNTSGTLYAINPDGTLKWTYQVNGGIIASPAIGNGVIYIVSSVSGGVSGRLYAIYSDGTLKWSIDGRGLDMSSSPAISPIDGTIYYGSGTGSRLHAIDPSDGSRKWVYIAPNYNSVYSSPTINTLDGSIYFGTHQYGFVVALSPDGTRRWAYPTWARLYSSPTISLDRTTVYAGPNQNGIFYAINAGDGILKWTYNMGTGYTAGDYITPSPIIDADGNIIVGGPDRKIHIFSPDGTLIWSYTLGSYPIFSTALIGSLYIIDGGGTLWAFGHSILGPSCVIKRDEGIYSKDRYCYVGEGIFTKHLNQLAR